MEVKISNEGARLLATIAGRVDTTNAEGFQAALAPLFDAEKPDIELDCSGLEYTSSQGLRIFLMLQKSVTSKGGALVMTNMQPKVKEIFDITGFSSIIKIL